MTIRIRTTRHHHEIVELCPSSEAPPQGLCEITSWPWGTTTIPSWNYVLTLRHYHELSLGGSMGLRSLDEAPTWALTMKVMELRPTHTLSMFHQPLIEFSYTSISCQYVYIYQTNWAYITPSSCQTHQLPAPI